MLMVFGLYIRANRFKGMLLVQSLCKFIYFIIIIFGGGVLHKVLVL